MNERKISAVAEAHFPQTMNCADNCIELSKIKSKLTLASTVSALLLGSLLTLNGVIYLQVNAINNKLAASEATAAALSKRLDVQRDAINTINQLHLREMK